MTAFITFNKLTVRFAKEAIGVDFINYGIFRFMTATIGDSRKFTEPTNFHLSVQEIVNNLGPESKRFESFDVCSINFKTFFGQSYLL